MLKGLRGTAFDVFGYTADRKLDRQLIADYETLVNELLESLSVDNHAVAVELAALPEHIRGYGSVKQDHLRKARVREQELLTRMRSAEWRPAAA
jgi:indolepyruvate ferredoxin oxidoreductase